MKLVVKCFYTLYHLIHLDMIYLGCAGWSYQHWRGTFYPRSVENELTFYSNYSLLNEINTTFYRIPSESMINRWYHSTPDDFIFSAKLNREITHVSRPSLKSDKISMFFSRMQGLGNKLQSILIQFPPRFRKTKKTYPCPSNTYRKNRQR